jgi:hypothetical protein
MAQDLASNVISDKSTLPWRTFETNILQKLIWELDPHLPEGLGKLVQGKCQECSACNTWNGNQKNSSHRAHQSSVVKKRQTLTVCVIADDGRTSDPMPIRQEQSSTGMIQLGLLPALGPLSRI